MRLFAQQSLSGVDESNAVASSKTNQARSVHRDFLNILAVSSAYK